MQQTKQYPNNRPLLEETKQQMRHRVRHNNSNFSFLRFLSTMKEKAFLLKRWQSDNLWPEIWGKIIVPNLWWSFVITFHAVSRYVIKVLSRIAFQWGDEDSDQFKIKIKRKCKKYPFLLVLLWHTKDWPFNCQDVYLVDIKSCQSNHCYFIVKCLWGIRFKGNVSIQLTGEVLFLSQNLTLVFRTQDINSKHFLNCPAVLSKIYSWHDATIQ